MGDWISVKDGMPEDDVAVMFWSPRWGGALGIGVHFGRCWTERISGEFLTNEDVTHWMPLPPPPKADWFGGTNPFIADLVGRPDEDGPGEHRDVTAGADRPRKTHRDP